MSVDVDNQMIYWQFDGKVFAKSVLTNYLKSMPCVAFFNCFSVEDNISIKQELKRKFSEVSFSGDKAESKFTFENENKLEEKQRIIFKDNDDKVLNPFRILYSVENTKIKKIGGS